MAEQQADRKGTGRSDEPHHAAAARRVRERKQQAERAANRAAQAALQRAIQDARGGDVRADALVDKRKKSRGQQVAERAERAAKVSSPASTSLRTVGDERVVTEMARASAAEGDQLLASSPVGVSAQLGAGVAFDPGFILGGAGAGGYGDGGGDGDGGDGGDPLAFDDPFGLTGGQE